MNKFHLRVYNENDNGHMVATCSFGNELELVEKSIELFKEAGGQVRYKVPEDGEKFISGITDKLLDAGDIHNPAMPPVSRLTFTPPKPEPVESEWERLKRELKGSRAKVFTYDVVKVMDELDRRCPAGGGKDGK